MTLEQQTIFIAWVDNIETAKNWTDNQFAIAAGLSHSVISKARSGILPRWDACASLADAAGVPREQVFRAAGLMKLDPKLSPIKESLLHVMDTLSDDDAEELVQIAETKARRRVEKAGNTVRKP